MKLFKPSLYVLMVVCCVLIWCGCRGCTPKTTTNNGSNINEMLVKLKSQNTYQYLNNDMEPFRIRSSPKPKFSFDINTYQYADYDKSYSDLLTLDLYAPKVESQRRPLIVFIHSGGFITGSKKGYVASKYCTDFASEGYVVASIDYRLITSLKFSDGVNLIRKEKIIRSKIYDSLTDIKTAIKYLVANADRFNIDRDNIFLAGYSAGAISALHIAYSSYTEMENYVGKAAIRKGDYNLRKFKGQGQDQHIDFKINGVVALAGGMLTTNHIDDTDDIKALLIHAEDDDMVPYAAGLPFSRYVKDYVLDLPGLYYELGITKSKNDGSSGKTTIGGNFSLRMPENFVQFIRGIFTSEMYGSKAIFDKLQGKGKLVTIKKGRHVFMRGPNNDFNQTYYDTKEVILDFLNENTKK